MMKVKMIKLLFSIFNDNEKMCNVRPEETHTQPQKILVIVILYVMFFAVVKIVSFNLVLHLANNPQPLTLKC